MTQTGRYLILAAALAAAAPASAQVARRGLPGTTRDTTSQRRLPPTGTIDGFVGDSALNPLLSAEVKLLSTNVKVNTGPNGRFRINLVPVGQYVLIVRRAGYAPTSVIVDVAAADTLRLSYTLERSMTSLAPAVTTTTRSSPRLMDFDMRRKLGRGEFLTEEEIDKRAAVYATDLMRRFMSVNVSPSSQQSNGGMPAQYAMSRREGGSIGAANSGGGGYCPMTVFVDDIRMPTPFNLDLLPSPRMLAGIEVYNGPATVPAQWAGFENGCGVILVWTKDGAR